MRKVVVALLAACTVAHAASAQSTPEVHKITFKGARTFADELLRAAIITNETSCSLVVFVCHKQYLDPVGLRGDPVRLRLFYYQRGFRQAKIEMDTVRKGDALDVHFQIDEGRPVRVESINIIGGEELPDDPALRRKILQPALPLLVGQPFSLIDYEISRDTLAARLANTGFARAEVLVNYTIPRDSPFIARVEYQIVPEQRLRFGPITVNGNKNVGATVVKRMLTFDTGDFYSYNDLLHSQRNLFGLETFRHVEIVANVNATTDTLVPVQVNVNEGNLHRVRVGLGLSTAEFLNAEALWTNRNFLGGARRLEARARVYNIFADQLHYVHPPFENTGRPYSSLAGSLSLDFSQPWFFDPLNSFNAGIYAERRSLPNIFVRTARGGYMTVSRALSPGETFSFGYRPELTELTAGGDLVFCTNFVACGAEEIQVLRDPHWLAPLAVSYARDRSNDLLSPSSGYVLRFDGEYAARATGSDFSYSRIIAELTEYSTLTGGVVLASRLRPGWARALGEPGQGLGLHPQKRFFGGGSNSVRGFAQFRMGPKLLTVDAVDVLAQDTAVGHCTAQTINAGTCDVSTILANKENEFEVRPTGGQAVLEGNLELRVPFFWDRLRAAVFVDFGQVWRQSRDVRLRDIVVTPGFGFRYFSAIGPVRVDFGYNPDPAERLQIVTTKVCVEVKGAPCTPVLPNVSYKANELTTTNELVTLGTGVWNSGRAWYDRFQIHFSIGQAF